MTLDSSRLFQLPFLNPKNGKQSVRFHQLDDQSFRPRRKSVQKSPFQTTLTWITVIWVYDLHRSMGLEATLLQRNGIDNVFCPFQYQSGEKERSNPFENDYFIQDSSWKYIDLVQLWGNLDDMMQNASTTLLFTTTAIRMFSFYWNRSRNTTTFIFSNFYTQRTVE